MLGDFITRCLVMALGYAYPAFECYKTVEKNRVEIEELRFWCQYWILVAILTVFERIGDIFVSWLPMYGELKLALFIYLWYPKTKGTGYIYEALLRPYMAKHETDIDRKIMEMRARAWDFLIYYWQNCTQLGQSTMVQVFQYLVSRSAKLSSDSPSNQKDEQENPNGQPQPQTPPQPTNPVLSFLRTTSEKQPNKNKRWPPTPPSTPSGTVFNRAMSESPKPNTLHVKLRSQTETAISEEGSIPEEDATISSPMSDKLHQARFRLRRTKPQQ